MTRCGRSGLLCLVSAGPDKGNYLASTIKTEIIPEGEAEAAHVEPLESDY